MQYKMDKPVSGTTGEVKYQCRIDWRNGSFMSDEPPSLGGGDTAPDPYTLLLASLVSCTVNTLRMYVERKGLEVSGFSVNANLRHVIRDGALFTYIDKDIYFGSDVTAEQQEKLLSIAKACPVSRLLESTIIMDTKVGEGAAPAADMLIRE